MNEENWVILREYADSDAFELDLAVLESAGIPAIQEPAADAEEEITLLVPESALRDARKALRLDEEDARDA